MEKLYRYEYDNTVENALDRINLVLHEFEVVKTTDKGVFISIHGKKRFVLTAANNKFAYSTPELAMEGFITRKKNEISILKQRIKVAEAYLRYCDNFKLQEA